MFGPTPLYFLLLTVKNVICEHSVPYFKQVQLYAFEIW